MLSFLIPIITILFSIVMVFIMNIIESNKFNTEKVGVISGLFLLLFFFSMFPAFYYRLKRRSEPVMVFENGVFTNYSKPMVKPVSIKIEEIKSINLWSSGKINQYKIVVLEDNSEGALMNQLKKIMCI